MIVVANGAGHALGDEAFVFGAIGLLPSHPRVLSASA